MWKACGRHAGHPTSFLEVVPQELHGTGTALGDPIEAIVRRTHGDVSVVQGSLPMGMCHDESGCCMLLFVFMKVNERNESLKAKIPRLRVVLGPS
jgi:hypothetical protein